MAGVLRLSAIDQAVKTRLPANVRVFVLLSPPAGGYAGVTSAGDFEKLFVPRERPAIHHSAGQNLRLERRPQSSRSP